MSIILLLLSAMLLLHHRRDLKLHKMVMLPFRIDLFHIADFPDGSGPHLYKAAQESFRQTDVSLRSS